MTPAPLGSRANAARPGQAKEPLDKLEASDPTEHGRDKNYFTWVPDPLVGEKNVPTNHF